MPRNDDTGILYERVAAENNLTVQALDVTLFGDVTVPRGDVKIVCRMLTIAPQSKGHEAEPGVVIDVSPAILEASYNKPWIPESATAADGADGADGKTLLPPDFQFGKPSAGAGSIKIVCDTLRLGRRLVLKASGGQGYPGGNGQNGGSPGGDGKQ